MRIATSTIYTQQTATIDEQQALYNELGGELSSGKRLTAPGDDPAQIGEDLGLKTTLAVANQQSSAVQGAVGELTTTDSALGNLVSVLQSARQTAMQGATDTLTSDQRSALGATVDQLLQQAIAIGNTAYGGKYVFGGTANGAPPVHQQGDPTSGVAFAGNDQARRIVANGQSFEVSTAFGAAFNHAAPDGSPDVFQTLIALRDALHGGGTIDRSAGAINASGATLYGPPTGPGAPPATTLASTTSFATAPVPDAQGKFAFTISSTANGAAQTATIVVPAGAALDDGVPPPGGTSVVEQINAASATTGVTASYDPKSQRITLQGSGSFTIADVPSPGSTTAGNLTKVLGLAGQADAVAALSTQLGDIDRVLGRALAARTSAGARINALNAAADQLQSTVTDTTKVASGIEDVDVASTVARFSQTQVALQAAYSTTTRLESKTLFDYLS